MLAVTAARFDSAAPLQALEVGQRPDPEVPPGWVKVALRAAAINRHDLWTLRGVGIQAERLPIVLGADGAGITEDGREVIIHAVIHGDGSALAEATSDAFSLLSEVYDGTHAEYVAVPAQNLIDKPAELSFAEAACLPVAWLTAYRMLFVRGGVRPGDHVLVQGAGGGVATAAVALGRAAGLHMTVTSRDAAKRARALELGAHEAVEAGARLAQRVDCVIETVGEATWGHSLRSLRQGGTIVCAGATTGPNPPADLRRVFFKELNVVGATMGTRADLVSLVQLLVNTGIRPEIDSVYPLAQARDAYAQLQDGDVFGKLVLSVGG